MADKRAIKVETLDELAKGFQESRGITDKLTTKQMIAFAKEPVGGENQIVPFFNNDATLELTEEDLKGLNSPLRANTFADRTLKSVELPPSVTEIKDYCFSSANIETVKTYASKFGRYMFQSAICPNIYFLSNTFTSDEYTHSLFYNNVANFKLHFNSKEAYENFLRVTIPISSVFQNIRSYYVYYGEDEPATEVDIPAEVVSFGSYGCYPFQKNKTIQIVRFLGDITFVSEYAFAEASNLQEVDFTACTTVPTLQSRTAFNSTASNLQIKVRSALYDEWISATNWSAWKNNIVAV